MIKFLFDLNNSINLIIKSMKSAKKSGRLKKAIISRVLNYISVLKYLIYNPAFKKVIIHAPKQKIAEQSNSELYLVKRLFKSYKLMKKNQLLHKKYLPSSLWSFQLNNAFSELNIAMEENNFEMFHHFIYNFGTSDKYLGIENPVLIKNGKKSLFGKLFIENIIFLKQYKLWKWFYNDNKPIKALRLPKFGNQCGAYLFGTFVGIGSFFNEIYGDILSKIVLDQKKPIISELGGGYGKLAYFTLKNLESFCYIGFDLPEIIILEAYYLSKCFPERSNLFYGEQDFNCKSFNNFDLIFMPSYEIEKLENNTVDLFINKNSLGEMEAETVQNYLNYICKSTHYLFHLNHDNYRNSFEKNNFSLLSREYPIPNEEFKLLMRYPDLGHFIGKGRIDFFQDIFLYLYEKKYKN